MFSAIGRFFHRVTPANGALRLLLLLFVAIAAAVLIARILLRRKRRVAVSSSPTVIVSFVELDSLADAALARGDFREAVLLRFRGGIARLERGPRPAASRLTNNRIAATIPNSFPAIGGTFDDIRYGGRAAERSAAFAARDEWPKIVREATATAVATDTSILQPTTRKRFRRRK